uniref:Uncharacterized protein n=1 Tax=Cacopsylla melanoneura TaxID=428564 RepID=A0A8D8SRB6_9HEMI
MSLSNQVSFLKLASVLDEINTSKKDQKSKLLKHFILQFQAEAKKTGKPFDEKQRTIWDQRIHSIQTLRENIMSKPRNQGLHQINSVQVSHNAYFYRRSYIYLPQLVES